MSRHLGKATLAVDGADPERTLPTLPRHVDLGLCRLLGIDVDRPLQVDEIAALLSGNTASGARIPGIVRRRESRSLGAALGIATNAIPTAAQIGMITRGWRADGTLIPSYERESLVRRLYEAFGVRERQTPTEAQLSNISAGLFADGTPAKGKKITRALHGRASPIAYRDFSFAADKSVSAAFAIGSPAERQIIMAAFETAIGATMAVICKAVGCARRGDGGRGGSVPGATVYLVFMHYTARATEDESGLRPGDPHLHAHCCLLNVVWPYDQKVGALYLGAIRGTWRELGAFFHAVLATSLRSQGIDVVLDLTRGSARIQAIPEALIDAFSARTNAGQELLQAYVKANGLAESNLTPRRLVSLSKQSVQGGVQKVRQDDLANEAAWYEAAMAHPLRGPIVSLREVASLDNREARMEIATDAARTFIEVSARNGLKVGAREAAARGLIASGVETMADVDRVAARIAGTVALEEPQGVIASKRRSGVAVMVEGGAPEVLEEAVIRRERLHEAGTPARILVRDDAEVAAATQLARELRRGTSLGPDCYGIKVELTKGSRATYLPLAVGDLIAFDKAVNGRGRGRVAAAGTQVEIVGFDGNGMMVRTSRGRVVAVDRDALAGRRQPVPIRYAYAACAVPPSAETTVVAATGGSRWAAAVATSPNMHFVFGSSIEMELIDDGERCDIEGVWRSIAGRFEDVEYPWAAAADALRKLTLDVCNRGGLLLERRGPGARIFPAFLGEASRRSLEKLTAAVAAFVRGRHTTSDAISLVRKSAVTEPLKRQQTEPRKPILEDPAKSITSLAALALDGARQLMTAGTDRNRHAATHLSKKRATIDTGHLQRVERLIVGVRARRNHRGALLPNVDSSDAARLAPRAMNGAGKAEGLARLPTANVRAVAAALTARKRSLSHKRLIARLASIAPEKRPGWSLHRGPSTHDTQPGLGAALSKTRTLPALEAAKGIRTAPVKAKTAKDYRRLAERVARLAADQRTDQADFSKQGRNEVSAPKSGAASSDHARTEQGNDLAPTNRVGLRPRQKNTAAASKPRKEDKVAASVAAPVPQGTNEVSRSTSTQPVTSSSGTKPIRKVADLADKVSAKDGETQKPPRRKRPQQPIRRLSPTGRGRDEHGR